MARIGRPPSSSSSTSAIPVAATSRIVRGAGVKTAGSGVRVRVRFQGGVRRQRAWRSFAFCSPIDSLQSPVLSNSATGAAQVGYSVETMCGRFARKSTQEVLAECLTSSWKRCPGLRPLNIAPQSTQPVVRLGRDSGGRETALLRWGLVPFWAKDAKMAYRLSTPALRKWRRSRPTARRSRSAAAWFSLMRSTSGSGSTRRPSGHSPSRSRAVTLRLRRPVGELAAERPGRRAARNLHDSYHRPQRADGAGTQPHAGVIPGTKTRRPLALTPATRHALPPPCSAPTLLNASKPGPSANASKRAQQQP